MKLGNLFFKLLIISNALLTGCTGDDPIKPEPAKGYDILEDWVTFNDFDSGYVDGDTETSILVIPINIPKSLRKTNARATEWNRDWIEAIEDVYTNPDSPYDYSVIPYFEQASFGKKEFDNYVAPVFEADRYTQSQIENDSSLQTLLRIFMDALKKTQDEYGDGFEERFDRNGDGYVDSLNFITNVYGSPSTTLWPHSAGPYYEIAGHLGIGRYTVTNTVHCQSEGFNVIIHELSHTFGIDDYYDYSYTGTSYIGSFDMQESNIGDWNAFSKFTVGWGTPYIINDEKDETTITVGSQNATGEYIVIAAEPWNLESSPFNEYFLLELISDAGNNKNAIGNYIRTQDGKSYGVRMFHANGTLCKVMPFSGSSAESYGIIKTFEDAELLKEEDIYKPQLACNNTVEGDSRPGVRGYENIPLLQVISKTGNNHFVNRKGWMDSYLTSADLFYTGDTFTFDRYSTFLTKDAKPQEAMNDGTYFPFSITFDDVSEDQMTVTITHNYE